MNGTCVHLNVFIFISCIKRIFVVRITNNFWAPIPFFAYENMRLDERRMDGIYVHLKMFKTFFLLNQIERILPKRCSISKI